MGKLKKSLAGKSVKQAGAELGQAQRQLELGFTFTKVCCITLMITCCIKVPRTCILACLLACLLAYILSYIPAT